MRKKVLFLIDSLHCGGAEKSLISLLPLLDYSAYEIHLMMVKRGGLFEKYIPSSVIIDDFPKTGGLWYKICQIWFSLKLRLLSVFGIKRHAAEVRWQCMGSAYPSLPEKYDVAVAYQQGFPTYYVAKKINADKKLAWINADIGKVGYREKFNSDFYKCFDGVCPVSDVLHSILGQSKFVEEAKLHTVFDILNVSLIKEMSKEKVDVPTINQSVEPNNQCYKIVTVGRMVPLKNYPLAIKTAKLLKEKNFQFLWLIVGEGSERLKVETLIQEYGLQDYIKLMGMQPNPYPYMTWSDIYVQTSSYEGFGLTLAEARILNKPVVSTNFPVVHDQITDGENGLIAEMNPESLADRILLLVNNQELRKHIIEKTKTEVNETARTESAKVNKLLAS